jgi:YkoY family integral membrane protein
MSEFISYILPAFNILILEILLSIDNAAVLATMVQELPEKQRKKALSYGIIGAYVLRGLSFVFVNYLLEIEWLKILGGVYLVYLAYNSLRGFESGKKFKFKLFFLNQFVSVIIGIELMDFVFSIDNIFAITAFSHNIKVIFIGVFIGIVVMRFASNKFIKIIEMYPLLTKISYYVIGFLGIRFILSYWFDTLNSTSTDLIFSGIVAIAFAIPIFIKKTT